MNINDLLTSGSEAVSGKGLLAQKKEKLEESRNIGESIVEYTLSNSITSAADHYSISELSVTKYLARAIKKDNAISAQSFLPQERVSEIESFIRSGNTTSIKRMVTVAKDRFTESEIRIVKADIEHRGVNQW